MPAPKGPRLQPLRALEAISVFCPGCLKFLGEQTRPDPDMACVPVERRCTTCGWRGWVQYHRRQTIPNEAFLPVDVDSKVKLVEK